MEGDPAPVERTGSKKHVVWDEDNLAGGSGAINVRAHHRREAAHGQRAARQRGGAFPVARFALLAVLRRRLPLLLHAASRRPPSSEQRTRRSRPSLRMSASRSPRRPITARRRRAQSWRTTCAPSRSARRAPAPQPRRPR